MSTTTDTPARTRTGHLGEGTWWHGRSGLLVPLILGAFSTYLLIGILTMEVAEDSDFHETAAADRIASLRPVEAIVCEGSGVQIDFARKLRTAGVPLHVFRKDGQAPVQPSQRSRRA
mgnify:CR=1 FL=1